MTDSQKPIATPAQLDLVRVLERALIKAQHEGTLTPGSEPWVYTAKMNHGVVLRLTIPSSDVTPSRGTVDP